jgi:hypothetical protein
MSLVLAMRESLKRLLCSWAAVRAGPDDDMAFGPARHDIRCRDQ